MNFDLPQNAALMAALAAAAGTLALFSVVLGLRLGHVVRGERLAALRATWWPILAETAAAEYFSADARLPRLRRGERLMLLREWSRFRGLIGGRAAVSLNMLAVRLRLLPVARGEMKRRLVDHRLLGLQVVGQLRDVDSWEVIDAVVESENVAVAVTAATALADIDPDRAITRILPLVARFPQWPRTQVGRILNHAGPETVSPRLCREIAAAPAGQAIRLLQFADSAFAADLNSVVAEILETRTDPPLLSAALKAARGRVCPDRVQALTRHEVWYVRMQAASLLGRTGLREDLAALEPLLADREWWVRYRAAQALVASPYLGPNALRRIAERQPDRFAHDILQQALAERGLA